MTDFDHWLDTTSLLILAALLLASVAVAAVGGALLRRVLEPRRTAGESQAGYVVSAILGLLALLMGFTFSLAVDRFETRRVLVLDEANAIGTTWLRAQLLDEPHRTRISDILVRFADNRIALANARPGPRQQALLKVNDRLLTDFWNATAAAFPSIREAPFSVSFLQTANQLIDIDAKRKAARGAKVPSEVFAMLFFYIVVTGWVLGYVAIGTGGKLATGIFLVLLILSLLLIVDIDRPTSGGIREAQAPMEQLRASLTASPR